MGDMAKMLAIAKAFGGSNGGNGTGGGGLPTGGAAHQMFVTDAEGKAKWEDRTHWAYTDVAEILPETTVTLDPDDPMAPIMEPLLTSLVAGNKYTVTYNGAEYVCVAQELNEDGVVVTMLGNVGSATGGADTGEPFVFVEYPPEYVEMFGTRAVLIVFAGTTTVTVKVTGEVETIKKIDSKFLPDGLEPAGVVYITSPDWNSDYAKTPQVYADAALTEPLDYATGSAMMKAGSRVIYDYDGVAVYNSPTYLLNIPSDRTSQIGLFNIVKMEYWLVTLTYSDSAT